MLWFANNPDVVDWKILGFGASVAAAAGLASNIVEGAAAGAASGFFTSSSFR